MTFKITISYNDLYNTLKPLEGVKLHGGLSGPPSTRFPLRNLIELISREHLDVEEHRAIRITSIKLKENMYVICHFNLEEPDDFCICVEGLNVWNTIKSIAFKLSKLSHVSYIELLSALIHAIYGVISAEEGEVEEIASADQIIEELLTWLPEYIAVTE